MNKLLILLMVFITSLVFALPEDARQPIEIEADSVVVDETTGLNVFSGDAEVKQGSLLLLADHIEVQTDNGEVVSMIAKGNQDKLAKYTQSQENQERFIEATAETIEYDVDKGMIFLQVNASLIQGFEYFSGHKLTYDINNNRVVGNSSEDGTQRVKFKITF
jgi:lipopolysaccharide export system protein LptA